MYSQHEYLLFECGGEKKKMVNDPYFSLSRQTNVIDSLGVVG